MALVKCKECGTEVSSKAKACPKCGASVPKGTGWGTKILLILGAVSVIGVLASKGGNGSTTATAGITSTGSSAGIPVPRKSPKDEALSKLEVAKLNWHKDGGGTIMIVDVTFKNNGTRDVKDIELTCEHASNSGTVIDSNKRTIYEVVKAGKTYRAKDFSMGFIHSQAAKTGCEVTDLVLI